MANLRAIEGLYFTETRADTIVLLEGVVTIGQSAFYDCSTLKIVIWPDTIATVDGSAFDSCTKLH